MYVFCPHCSQFSFAFYSLSSYNWEKMKYVQISEKGNFRKYGHKTYKTYPIVIYMYAIAINKKKMSKYLPKLIKMLLLLAGSPF